MTEIERTENQKHIANAHAMTAIAVAKALEKQGLTLDFAAQRLREAVDAEETKVRYDAQDKRFKYSKPLVNHGIRLQALQYIGVLLGIDQVHKQPGEGGQDRQYIDLRRYEIHVHQAPLPDNEAGEKTQVIDITDGISASV